MCESSKGCDGEGLLRLQRQLQLCLHCERRTRIFAIMFRLRLAP